MIGGAVAAIAGSSDDVNANFATGQTTATNAVNNNFLRTRQILDALGRLHNCDTLECQLLRRTLTRDQQQGGDQTSVGSLQDRCKGDPSGCVAEVLDIKKGLDYLQTPQARQILGAELADRLIARQSQDLAKALDALKWGAEHIESSRQIVGTLLAVGALALGGGVAVALVRTIGAACASGALSPGCVAVVTELGIVAADTAAGVPVSTLAAPGLAAVAANRLAAAAARGDAALARELQLIQLEARAAATQVAIPTGFNSFNVDGLPPGLRGVVNSQTGEIRVITPNGTLIDVPAAPIPANINASVVPQSTIGIKWGGGIQEQGLPFEDYLATQLPAGTRLPPNFKTFDFFDAITGVATSAKTMDTMTAAKINDPSQVFSSLKGNVDTVANFSGTASLSGRVVDSAGITARELRVAIPSGTTQAQWTQINKAIQYGQSKGVTVKITVVN